MAEFIHDSSPGTALVLRDIGRGLDYGWDGDIQAKANAVADAHIAALSPFLKFDPWVESHNEPPDWNDDRTLAQNIERAKRGNEWQVIVAGRLHAAGFKHVLAYSFSVGTPRPDFWPHYQDGVAACEGLALHEYWRPGALPQAGLTFRYRDAYAAMTTKRPIMLTELGLGFDAGYQAYGNLAAYLAQLDQYEAELAKDDYLLAAQLFVCSKDSAQWETWDVMQDSEYETQFIPWLKAGQLGAVTLPPASPPPVVLPPVEDVMRTAEQRVAAAWHSLGVDFNPDAALMLKAKALGLGYPLANEDRDRIAGEPVIALQAFGPEGVTLETEEGKWATDDIKAFAITTGAPWVRPAPVVVGPPAGVALPYRFPIALSNIGALGEEGSPVAGQSFYRLSGAAVRRGVSAFMVVTVIGKNGAPVIGAKVLNLFPDGNGEIIQTDGSGTARFQFGASSAFTNRGAGPFTICVVDDSAFKDSDSVPKRIVFKMRLSDVVKSLGDFEGQHTEINIQMIEQP